MEKLCPLCQSQSKPFYKDTQEYRRCVCCRGIFVVAHDLPPSDEEKKRYELHDTNTQDEGYRRFVSPITSRVIQEFTPYDKGLDFGAGTSQIISCVLQEHGFCIQNYDPYFHPNTQLLQNKYNYITSCEVIEHFYHPAKEFALLRGLLHKGAKLYLMTDIYDERDFTTWYYKNDPTHVFFYTKESFEWIQKAYNFKTLFIDKRLIVLSL